MVGARSDKGWPAVYLSYCQGCGRQCWLASGRETSSRGSTSRRRHLAPCPSRHPVTRPYPHPRPSGHPGATRTELLHPCRPLMWAWMALAVLKGTMFGSSCRPHTLVSVGRTQARTTQADSPLSPSLSLRLHAPLSVHSTLSPIRAHLAVHYPPCQPPSPGSDPSH